MQPNPMQPDPIQPDFMPPGPVPADDRPRPLPPGAKAASGVLLAIPLVALAIVPVYSKSSPKLWGFPFFYWYQFLWVFLAGGCTWAAYLVVTNARRGRR
jgi:hypothetical protein